MKGVCMPWVAVLNRDFVLEGFERVDAHEADTQYRIGVPDECDLIPQKYMWRHDRKRFVPVDDPDEVHKYDHALKRGYEVLGALSTLEDLRRR